MINEEETDGVSWIPLDKVVESSTELHMKTVYQKGLDKMKQMKIIAA